MRKHSDEAGSSLIWGLKRDKMGCFSNKASPVAPRSAKTTQNVFQRIKLATIRHNFIFLRSCRGSAVADDSLTQQRRLSSRLKEWRFVELDLCVACVSTQQLAGRDTHLNERDGGWHRRTPRRRLTNNGRCRRTVGGAEGARGPHRLSSLPTLLFPPSLPLPTEPLSPLTRKSCLRASLISPSPAHRRPPGDQTHP